jgi:hypothetical protein
VEDGYWDGYVGEWVTVFLLVAALYNLDSQRKLRRTLIIHTVFNITILVSLPFLFLLNFVAKSSHLN